jgi:hypothetical protein
MKKFFVIVLSIIIVSTASAQVKGGGHYYRGGERYFHPHARVIVGVGAGYYSPYYYPFYSFPPYCYGYWRPSRLELKIQDIQADYKDRIYSVRHDKSMSKSERKALIHQLKSDRELAIHDAQRNYYKSFDDSPGASGERRNGTVSDDK